MSTIPPAEQFRRFLTGYWYSQAIYVAAKLGVADQLKDGPRSANELASATGAHAPSIYRLLRTLASIGVFAEQATGQFALTPLAENLRSDLPGSQRALAIMMGEEHYACYGRLLDAVKDGRPVFEKIFNAPIFEYLSHHPEQGRIFDQAMVDVHGQETAAMLDAYDFANIGVLADVGGGNGSLLTAVLQRHRGLQGMLVDLPSVIERARGNLQKAGLADRCQAIAGNFFESVPSGADVYLMRHIIHDWNDELAARILRNVRAALPPQGKLLLVEGVVRPGNDPSFIKALDLTMLVIPGGKERTEAEYAELFAGAGMRLARIVPTAGEVSVIEAVPA